jgi:hypothetical protein
MTAKDFLAHDGLGSRAPTVKEAEPPGLIPKPIREPKSGERLFTPKEAADFLRVSLSWLAKARMRGDGPPYAKLGRAIRYPETGLIGYTKSRLRLSTSEH